MPMHPEVACATVVMTTNPEDSSVIDFSLDIPGVGTGECWLETVNDPLEMGYVKATPQHIGIGTKIVQAMLDRLGSRHFQSEVFHRDTLAQLASVIAQARKQRYQPIIITDEGRLKELPIVQFLAKARAQVDWVKVVYNPHKYEELSVIVTLYGRRAR